MNKNLTLVILAAGMGSRFGGLKQVAPMGPNGEFIIDYSIYDAKQAGFNKVVFLIKEENYEIFKNTIGKRVSEFINVEYCFQKNDNLPESIKVPEERVKPLGTAHAILCCKDAVNEPFMIINADDFYGRDAFVKGANFLRNVKDTELKSYGLIGYKVVNTMTENGSVKRGVCIEEDGKLKSIIESKIEKIDGNIKAEPLSGQETFTVSSNQTVSMNMLLFTPSIFTYIDNNFEAFLQEHASDILTCEYLIPDVLAKSIDDNYAEVNVIPTDAEWHGVTYKEDTPSVKEALLKLVNDGVYPNQLFKKEEN